jgi:hypothetical protein
VKAAEGLFEALPQLIIQMYIVIRYYLEPVHRKTDFLDVASRTDVMGPAVDPDYDHHCTMFTTMSELKAEWEDLITFDFASESEREHVLPWSVDPFFSQSCTACGYVWQDEPKQCVQDVTVFQTVIFSIVTGLLSNASTIATLPEKVRGQWRGPFFLLIFSQVLLRLLCLSLFSTVLSLVDPTGFNGIFIFFMLLVYSVQVLFAKTHNADKLREQFALSLGRKQIRAEAVQKTQTRVFVESTYTVLKLQRVQTGFQLNSKPLRTGKYGSKILQIEKGDKIRTKEKRYLTYDHGICRVRLDAGWVSVQDKKGTMLLKPDEESKLNAKHLEAGFFEKAWVGLLTLIMPVKFDTIKNLHKSNPDMEDKIPFLVRNFFNIVMYFPFLGCALWNADSYGAMVSILSPPPIAASLGTAYCLRLESN